MEHETFTLFDASKFGGITAEDIADVAHLYSLCNFDQSLWPYAPSGPCMGELIK